MDLFALPSTLFLEWLRGFLLLYNPAHLSQTKTLSPTYSLFLKLLQTVILGNVCLNNKGDTDMDNGALLPYTIQCLHSAKHTKAIHSHNHYNTSSITSTLLSICNNHTLNWDSLVGYCSYSPAYLSIFHRPLTSLAAVRWWVNTRHKTPRILFYTMKRGPGLPNQSHTENWNTTEERGQTNQGGDAGREKTLLHKMAVIFWEVCTSSISSIAFYLANGKPSLPAWLAL